VIDAKIRKMVLDISGTEMKRRAKAWRRPKPRYTKGVLAKFAHLVADASHGAVTDEGLSL
jgi:dihydroxy-acid dehydratase